MISIQIFYALLGSGSKLDSQDTIHEILENFCETSRDPNLITICKQFRTEICKYPTAVDELINGLKLLIEDDRENEVFQYLVKHLDSLQELRVNHYSVREKFISLMDSRFPLLDTILTCSNTETVTDDSIVIACLAFLMQNSEKQTLDKFETRNLMKKLDSIIKEAHPDAEKILQNELANLCKKIENISKFSREENASLQWVQFLGGLYGLGNLMY